MYVYSRIEKLKQEKNLHKSKLEYCCLFAIVGMFLYAGSATPSTAGTNVTALPSLLLNHKSVVHAVAFSPDSSTIATAGMDSRVKLWNTQTGKLKMIFPKRDDVTSVVFSPDGRVLATGGGGVTLWNAGSGHLIKHIPTSKFSTGLTVLFAPNGKELIVGTGKDYGDRSGVGVIETFDIRTGKLIRQITAHASDPIFLTMSPDGRTIVSSIGSEIRAWDARSGKPLEAMTKKLQSVLVADKPITSIHIAFSSNGKLIAGGLKRYAYDPRSTEIWDGLNGSHLFTLEGGGGPVVFQPKGKILATGSQEGNVKFWDVSTGKLLDTLTGNSHTRILTFSPNGKLFAFTTDANMVQVQKITVKFKPKAINGD